MRWVHEAYHTLWLKHPVRRRAAVAVMIVLLAVSARVHLAYSGRIEYDEKNYARAAVQYSNYLKSGDLGLIIRDDYNYEHPPLNKLVYALTLLPFPAQAPFDLSKPLPVRQSGHFQEVVAMRWVSVAFGSLSVLLLALLNPLAGLFLAVHTYAIKYTSVIYLEALPLFAALLSFQAFSIFLTRGPGRPTLRWLMLSAAALGIAAAAKYMYAVVGVVMVLYCAIWMLQHRQPVFRYLVLWAFGSLLVFWAADPYLWVSPIRHLAESLKFSIDFANGPAVRFTAYPRWQPIQWLLRSMPQHPQSRITAFFLQPGDFWITIDTWIFGLAIVGLPLLIKRRPEYFTWLVVGLAFLLIWSTKWPQYVLLILPPLCLAAAAGVQTLLLIANTGLRLARKNAAARS